MNRYRILLVLIILLSIITQLVWLRIDRRPPAYDEAAYLERSLELSEAIRMGPVEFMKSVLGLGRYRSSYHPHRALLPLTTLPFYFLFGNSADVGVMANIVYLVIVLISVYGIGKKLFGEKVGLFSAFILATFPLFSSMSRVFMPELSATALATLSIYLLICSHHFQNRRLSLLFGFTLGLGLISKELYLIALLGPLIYIVAKSNLIQSRVRLYNLSISVLLGIFIASFWYLPNLDHLQRELFHVAFSQEMGNLYQVPTKIGFWFFTFYPIVSINYGLSLFYSVAFCGAFLSFAKLKKPLPVFWLIISYIILTLSWEKDPIYILVAFPAIALIIAAGIMGIYNQKVRKSILSFVIVIGLLQSFAYSFDLSPLSKGVTWHPIKSKNVPKLFFRSSYESFPVPEEWKTEKILQFITDHKKASFPDEKECVIKVIPNHPGISWSIFSYYIYLNELPLKVMKGDPQFMKSIDYENILKGYHYVVTKTGEQGEGDWDRDFMMTYSQKILEQLEGSSSYKKLDKQFLLPDGSLAQIYWRTS